MMEWLILVDSDVWIFIPRPPLFAIVECEIETIAEYSIPIAHVFSSLLNKY